MFFHMLVMMDWIKRNVCVEIDRYAQTIDKLTMKRKTIQSKGILF